MVTKILIPDVVAGCMRLGVWGANYNKAQYHQFIEECISLGVSTFDHADIYGDYTTEAEFGEVLKNNSSLRNKIQLITKCGILHPHQNRPQYSVKAYDSSPAHIRASVLQSLKNFNTDYIDVLLLHRPDYLMNPIEIAREIEQLKKEGKILSFGVSNFTVSQFELLNQYTPLITNQIQASILHRTAFEEGSLDQCISKNIRPMAWSPLAGGKFEDNLELKSVLSKVANELQVATTHVLYAFLMNHPAKISVVTGTTKPKRIKEAIAANKIKLTRTQWYTLWQAASGFEIP